MVFWAVQEAVVPPPTSLQVQVQGPMPETAAVTPEVQRLSVGAVVSAAPLALPQTPLIGIIFKAEQEAVTPPSTPLQVQFQGPEPESPE
jgi:hypothetical protein